MQKPLNEGYSTRGMRFSHNLFFVFVYQAIMRCFLIAEYCLSATATKHIENPQTIWRCSVTVSDQFGFWIPGKLSLFKKTNWEEFLFEKALFLANNVLDSKQYLWLVAGMKTNPYNVISFPLNSMHFCWDIFNVLILHRRLECDFFLVFF